jgi:two-component system cell cycle sensor histidine kinase/response regulator CckA
MGHGPSMTTATTILLVEDEAAVRVIVRTVLRRHGYVVIEADTPSQAIAMFNERAAEIDLLLTDVLMPEMDGPSLARHLIAIRPALRILFMSGYTDTALVGELVNPNIGFVSKPFDAATLASSVKTMLSP